jgi:putative ABC transport system substrate-binding protein
MAPDLGGKRLELLKESLPDRISRVAVLWNAANPYPALVFKETQRAAHALGIEILSLEVRGPDDLDSALEAAVQQRAVALIAVEDPLTLSNRQKIANFSVKNGLPSVEGTREFAEAGALMAYGASLAHEVRAGR